MGSRSSGASSTSPSCSAKRSDSSEAGSAPSMRPQSRPTPRWIPSCRASRSKRTWLSSLLVQWLMWPIMTQQLNWRGMVLGLSRCSGERSGSARCRVGLLGVMSGWQQPADRKGQRRGPAHRRGPELQTPPAQGRLGAPTVPPGALSAAQASHPLARCIALWPSRTSSLRDQSTNRLLHEYDRVALDGFFNRLSRYMNHGFQLRCWHQWVL